MADAEGSVLTKFHRFFRPGDVASEAEADRIRDIQRFVGTNTYRQLRERIEASMRATRWTPGMDNETATSQLIAQTIYGQILDEMDKLVEMALENRNG